MNTTELETLKIGANQFYLNKDLDKGLIKDYVYDELKRKYEAEGGSLRDLVDWDPDMRRPNTPLPKVEKEQVWDNDLQKAVFAYVQQLALLPKYEGKLRFYQNYKYDGSSIIAYYSPEGLLKCILGTPDAEMCMDRTKNCWRMFPHKIMPGIECIQGEFLVDATHYGQLARNKANGLLNSKDMIDDIEKEGFIRIYQMRFYEGEWSIDRLVENLSMLPRISMTRVRNGVKYNDLIFSPAEQLEDAPKESIITETSFHGFSTPKFQVDGTVLYSSDGYHAFKFYYTESAVTTVTKVVWTLQNNGGYSCKLWFDPIRLNDKTISQASSGGVPNLMNMKMGKGAKIRVILANMTIPKVVEVLRESEDYEWPKCECGYQMSEKDIFGSTLKCQADLCTTKYNLWKDRINDIFDGTVESFVKNRFAILDQLLNIDRWSAKGSYINNIDSQEDRLFNTEMYKAFLTNDVKLFREQIAHNFRMSDLCWNLFEINSGVAFLIIRDKIIK